MSLTYDAGAKALRDKSVDLDSCGVMLMDLGYTPDPGHTWRDVLDYVLDGATRRHIRVRFDGGRFDADDPEAWTLPFGMRPGGAVVYCGETPLFYLDAPEVKVSYALHFHPQGIAV